MACGVNKGAMDFFQIDSVINACDSYENLVKTAAAQSQQAQESMLGTMLGVVDMVESKARRFLDQFGQFDVYNDGDIYAVLPQEQLDLIASRTNFSIISKFKREKEFPGVNFYLLKFAKGSKYPVVLIHDDISEGEKERLKNIRKIEEVYEHLRFIIDSGLISDFNKNTLDFDSVKKLRNFLASNKTPKPQDFTDKVKIGEGEEIPLSEFRFHIIALYTILTQKSGAKEFNILVRKAFELYKDPKKRAEFEKGLQSGQARIDEDDKSRELFKQVEKVLIDLKATERVPELFTQEAVENYIRDIEFDEGSKTPQRDKLINLKRTYGLDAISEVLIRVEKQIYRIPPVKAKYIERAFIDIPDSEGKKLSEKIRSSILEQANEKNWSPTRASQEFRAALSQAVLKQVKDLDVRPAQKLGDIIFESFAANKKLFPGVGSLSPSFPLDEYFDDPQVIADFNAKIDNEDIASRIKRQTLIIKNEIKKIGDQVDQERINRLHILLNDIKNGDLEAVSNIINNIGDYFKTKVLANQFVKSFNSQPEPESSEREVSLFIDMKLNTMEGLVEKEIDFARNVSKVAKLLELRHMIDPQSDLFYIADIYNNVNQANKITALCSYLRSSLTTPFRMPQITVASLPEAYYKAFEPTEDEEDKAETAEEQEDEFRPESFYIHEIEKGKSKKAKQIETALNTSVYLLNLQKYRALERVVKSIGEKYKNVLLGITKNNKLKDYSISKLIVAYKLVTGYFGFDFDLLGDYKTKLQKGYYQDLQKTEQELNALEMQLETIPGEVENIFGKNVPNFKIYNDNIIVPSIIKDQIDVLISLGFNDVEGPDKEEARLKQIKKIKEQAEKIEELYGEEEADEFYEQELQKINNQKDVWDSLVEMAMEEQIAVSPDDNYWKWFTQLRDSYSDFMKRLEKSNYKFNVNYEDPIGKERKEQEEEHPGVVSGQRGEHAGQFKLQPTRPLDTMQYFPTNWNPLIELFTIDDEGHYVLDDNGNKILEGTYSLLDPDFWQDIMALPQAQRNFVILEAKNRTKELTVFETTDDPALIAKTLSNLAKNTPEYEKRFKQQYSKKIRTEGQKAADVWAINERLNPSIKNTRRAYDVESGKSWKTIEPLNFEDVFDTSVEKYKAEQDALDAVVVSKEQVEESFDLDKWFKTVATYEQKQGLKPIIERQKYAKRNKKHDDVEKEQKAINDYKRQVVENSEKYKNEIKNKTQEQKVDWFDEGADLEEKGPAKTIRSEFTTRAALEEHYRAIAEIRLPAAITNAILNKVLSGSSVLQSLIVDSSEYRVFIQNKIKNFVNNWLDANKTKESYIKHMNELIQGGAGLHAFCFSIEEIFQSFKETFPNIPLDTKIYAGRQKIDYLITSKEKDQDKDSKEKIKDIQTDLEKRRLLFYLMNKEERLVEGLDVPIYFDKELGDVIIENAISETYKLDDMMRGFAEKRLADAEKHQKTLNIPIDFKQLPITIAEDFMLAISPASPERLLPQEGYLFDVFRGLSTNASLFFAEKYNKTDDTQFRDFVVDRMVKFCNNYFATENKDVSIVKDKKEWEKTFSHRTDDKEVIEHIYNLVEPSFMAFEDLKKEKIIYERPGDKTMKGRIAFLLAATKVGIILPSSIEKMLNLVVGEVHSLDTKIYEQLSKEIKQVIDKNIASEEPIQIDIENVSKKIVDSLGKGQGTQIPRIIEIMQSEIINSIKQQGEAVEAPQGSSSDWEFNYALTSVIENFIKARTYEMYAEIQDQDETHRYNFNKNSSTITQTIMSLMPLKEFERYDFDKDDVFEMVLQAIDANSFQTYDPKNRRYFTQEQRRFVKNKEFTQNALDIAMQDKVQEAAKGLVKTFFWLEKGIIKQLSTLAPEFSKTKKSVPSENQEAWIQRSIKSFLGELGAASKEPTTESTPTEQEKPAKEVLRLLRAIGLTKESPEVKNIIEYIKERISKLRGKIYSTTIDKKDKHVLNQIVSIIKSKYENDLESLGYDDKKLRQMVLSYMEDPESFSTKTSDEGYAFRKLINEKQKDKAFSLVSYDDVKTFGSSLGDLMIVMMIKKLQPEVFHYAIALHDINCTSLDDVNKIENPTIRNNILENYDEDGIERLLQLYDVMSRSPAYRADDDNYFVRLRGVKKGDIKHQIVPARPEPASVSWEKQTKYVPILDTKWRKEKVTTQEEGGMPKTEYRLKSFIVEEEDLNSKIKENDESDFFMDAVSKWSKLSGFGTQVVSQYGETFSIADFFGGFDTTIGEMVGVEYRTAIISEKYLSVLEGLLNQAVKEKVFDKMTIQEYNEYQKEDKDRKETLKLKMMPDIKIVQAPQSMSLSSESLPEGIQPGVFSREENKPRSENDINSIVDQYLGTSESEAELEEIPTNEEAPPEIAPFVPRKTQYDIDESKLEEALSDIDVEDLSDEEIDDLMK